MTIRLVVSCNKAGCSASEPIWESAPLVVAYNNSGDTQGYFTIDHSDELPRGWTFDAHGGERCPKHPDPPPPRGI